MNKDSPHGPDSMRTSIRMQSIPFTPMWEDIKTTLPPLLNLSPIKKANKNPSHGLMSNKFAGSICKGYKGELPADDTATH